MNSRELVEQAESLRTSLNVWHATATRRASTWAHLGRSGAQRSPSLNAVVHEPRSPPTSSRSSSNSRSIESWQLGAWQRPTGRRRYQCSTAILFELPDWRPVPYSRTSDRACPPRLEKCSCPRTRRTGTGRKASQHGKRGFGRDGRTVNPDAVEAAAKKAFAKAGRAQARTRQHQHAGAHREDRDLRREDHGDGAQSQILVGTFRPEETSKDIPCARHRQHVERRLRSFA